MGKSEQNLVLDVITLVGMSSLFSSNTARWVKEKVTQLCPTLCDPMDYTVHGILQTRILEWVAFPLSRGSSQPRNQTQVSHIAGFPGSLDGKASAYSVGDLGSIPGLGRSPGEGKGYPLQYSGLEDSMDCMVHGIAKSQIQLSDFHSLTQEAQKASPRLWREGASCSPTI